MYLLGMVEKLTTLIFSFMTGCNTLENEMIVYIEIPFKNQSRSLNRHDLNLHPNRKANTTLIYIRSVGGREDHQKL